MEQFYTIHEIAKKLSMAEDTIREKVKKGEFNGGSLPALKNGKNYRIPESGVNAYIMGNSVKPPKPVNLRGFFSNKKDDNTHQKMKRIRYEDVWPNEVRNGT